MPSLIILDELLSNPNGWPQPPTVHELDPIEEWMRVIFKWYHQSNPHW